MSLEGYELRFDPCHHRPTDSLGEFIDGFCDGISAPVTIRSWLTRMVRDEPVQIPIDAPRLSDSIVSDRDSVFTPSPNPPVPLPSSTAVSMRTSRNLMTACRKNLQRWLVT